MAAAINFYLPEKSQFFAFSPAKVDFKKCVKYNIRAGINHKGMKPAASLKPSASK
jgi:hypothetical protein